MYWSIPGGNRYEYHIYERLAHYQTVGAWACRVLDIKGPDTLIDAICSPGTLPSLEDLTISTSYADRHIPLGTDFNSLPHIRKLTIRTQGMSTASLKALVAASGPRLTDIALKEEVCRGMTGCVSVVLAFLEVVADEVSD